MSERAATERDARPASTAPRPDRTSTGVLSDAEKDVVRRLTGGFGWPTVLFAAFLLASQAAIVVGWAVGTVPVAVGFFVNSVIAYAWYTVHHDATHSAISGRDPKRRWIEQACGTVAGVMLQLEFSSYARNHLRHHAHTNTAKDPDLVVKGPMWQLPVKWAVANIVMTIGLLPGGGRIVERMLARFGGPVGTGTERDRADRGRMRRISQAEAVVLLATIPFGWFWPALLLWWLPSRVGVLYLMVLFQWLPHFPFDRTDRFGATRVTRFPGSTWLLLQQDRHLIHHLYPQIPWYRYRAAFRELLPILEAKGAIIQGYGTSPHVPIQLRETSVQTTP